ncbi:efflux transporter, outer membrane factor lipoprotein, NodT family [Verrucomicrobiia bacterium DG1235]|nr:efflux transporter, outer membrane factor lipoprotein, NodT family [Verrucomicrobiae bacterium DG1235]
MKRLQSAALLALSLALAGCQSTTRWSEQETIELPSSFQQADDPQLEIKDSLLELFANPQLDQVVEAALDNNPDLLRAQARLEEVGFSLTRAKSSLLPKLSAGASAIRSEAVGATSSTDTFSAELDASWEVDIWGKVRSSVRASKADLAAAEADFQAAQQSLVGQTMQAWFALVAAEKILDLDQRRVTSFESTEKLVSRRFDLGTATLSELNLSQTDLQNARADLESSADAKNRAARRLQTILGSYPSDQYEAKLDWPELNASLAAGIPSQLLTARPDVAAAYQRVRAADARVTVTQTELFPSFRLTANGGRAGPELENLSDSAFNSWSAIASLAVTLFDAGARRSDIGAANKRAEQAYYNYQTVVLNALREVEDAIGSEYYLAREESARLAALDAARRSLNRSQRDYETGLISILSLLETQRRVFTTERQVINLKASRLNNRVSLALALGKGA